MQLYALGLNHHTAPLEIRERVAFDPMQLADALHDLTSDRHVKEAAILSTCNRTELYFSTHEPQRAADWLANFHRLALQEVSPYLYAHPQRDAVRHVFRVACGLDSMVLGEPQILGQIKSAAKCAEQAGTLGTLLHKLFQNTFAVAKEIRSTTTIGANIVSMAAAAVHLSERIFENIADQSVLLIGAGEMIELCATHFATCAPRRMAVMNRTEARAATLAQRYNADTLRLDQLGDVLPEFDIVISCTAAPLPIVGLGVTERAVKKRRHRPMVMVDLAVPRDIEAEVNRLNDVFLYTVDDLSQIVNNGMSSRREAVTEAENIIDSRVDHFFSWLQTRQSVPTIRALRDQAEQVRLAQLQRALQQLQKGEDPHAVLHAFSNRLMNQFLHHPTRYLNQAQPSDQSCAHQQIRHIFNLDQEN